MTNWLSQFDTRQQQEIAFAQTYKADYDHGTSGHLAYTVIAKLADLLDATDAPLTNPNFHLLDVPYHSQHESDAEKYRRDCGPACIEMVGKYYYPAAKATTDNIMARITGGDDRSIYISELQRVAFDFFNIELVRRNGATWTDLISWIALGKPVIVLGHYGSLLTRMDRNYTGGHYVVVVGMDAVQYQDNVIERVIIHDPDYYGGLIGQGAFIPLVKSHFMSFWDKAYLNNNPRRMALVPQ